MSEQLNDSSAEAIALGVPAAVSRLERKERVINAFAGITQFFTWPLFFVLFNSAFRIRVEGRENFRAAKAPFIIVSNHISFYDSFVFRLVLGLWTPHLPLRFMAVDRFNWRWLNFLADIGVISFIYSLFGVFVVRPGLGIEKNLEEAVEILRTGGNVVIYPEGDIIAKGEIAPFRRGAAVLSRKTGVSVIPVSFRFVKRGERGRELRVNVGGPMNMLPGHTDTEVSESLRSAVTNLHGKID